MGGARAPNDGHDRAITTGGMLTAPVTWFGVDDGPWTLSPFVQFTDDRSLQFAAGVAAALDLATVALTAGPQASFGVAVKLGRPKKK